MMTSPQENIFNPSSTNVPPLYPVYFAYFQGDRSGTLVENGLISGWLWGSFHIDYIFTFSIDSGTIDAYLGQYQTPMMELFLGENCKPFNSQRLLTVNCFLKKTPHFIMNV